MPEARAGGHRRRGHWERLAVDLGAGYLIAWLVGAGLGLALARSPRWNVGFRWEIDVMRWIHAHPLPRWADLVMLAVPWVGTNLTLLPLSLVVGALLWWRRRRLDLALQILSVSLGPLSMIAAMKAATGRMRPELWPKRGQFDWESYPSGHSITGVCYLFTIALLLHRERGWRWPFVVAACVLCVNAYSRLYLGLHWPTDIVGGIVIGVIWLAVTWRAFDRLRSGDGRRASDG